MEDPRHACGSRLTNHGARILLGLARVDDKRPARFGGELDLRGEGFELTRARGVVVMVVEPALADGNRARGDGRAEAVEVTLPPEVRGIVRVDAGGEEDEAGMSLGDLRRPGRRGDLRVIANVVIPRALDDEQRRLLERLAETMTDGNTKSGESMFAKLKRLLQG